MINPPLRFPRSRAIGVQSLSFFAERFRAVPHVPARFNFLRGGVRTRRDLDSLEAFLASASDPRKERLSEFWEKVN